MINLHSEAPETRSRKRVVVLSPPMLFPWVGMLEQIRSADVYVHDDDIPFSSGGFINRVPIKTTDGPRWLTIPLNDVQPGQLLRDVRVDDTLPWRWRHLTMFRTAYARAPHVDEAIAMMERVYRVSTLHLVDILVAGITELSAYFNLPAALDPLFSTAFDAHQKSSERVLEIVSRLRGNVYLSGHAGLGYLHHTAFDSSGVRVEYLRYQKARYPQLHGDFTPYVSALDLVANLGREGLKVICSRSVGWRDLLPTQRDGFD